MKKLVKRNIPKVDTVLLYASCSTSCQSTVCTYQAARQDKQIEKYMRMRGF